MTLTRSLNTIDKINKRFMCILVDVALFKPSLSPDPPGQEPSACHTERDRSCTMLLTDRYQLPARLPRDGTELHQDREDTALCHIFNGLAKRQVAKSVTADLALGDQVIESLYRLLHWSVRIVEMHTVDVNPISLEPPQAVFARRVHITAGQTRFDPFSNSDLRRYQDLVAKRPHCVTKDGLCITVSLCCVKEIDSQLVCTLQHGDDLIDVLATIGPTERIAPHSHGRELYAAMNPVIHRSPPSVLFCCVAPEA